MKYIQESSAIFPELARIPVSFMVNSRLTVTPVNEGLGGMLMGNKKENVPWEKDYDRGGERPGSWEKKWAVSHWGVFSAFDGPDRVGCAVVAYDTERLDMLQGRRDLAVLWDLRVHPDYRQQGLGTELFGLAEAFANSKECLFFKAETQNINVPACRFYIRQGCRLAAMDQFAYEEYPEEVQLIWVKYIG